MKEACYFHDGTVIMNYSKKYIRNGYELVSSEVFEEFLNQYIDYLSKHHIDLYEYLTEGYKSDDSVKEEMKALLKLIQIMDLNQVKDPFLRNPKIFLQVIESGYDFWRKIERYGVLYTHNEEGYNLQSFLAADGNINNICLNFYRTIEEKVQGTPNKIYRQLHSGTIAALLLRYYEVDLPEEYDALEGEPFINQILLRTPLILHPKSNKRTNTFTEFDHNPIEDFIKGDEEWVCYPAKVGTMLIFAYFHRNYITSAVAMCNLFELAGYEETISRKPDAIMLFGNPDGRKDTVFYHDEKNDIWVGKNSAAPEIDYFGYTKKSILTLHNLAMMKKGWLPIHGAMVNIYLKDGTKKGLMFMGDSGAGKSESIEALSVLASDVIDHQETVFDDMGTIHIDEKTGEVVAQGTEIGAFVRLDDLDKGTAYRDMDRSIFFNPEKPNARVVLPAAPYSTVVTPHHIDCFLYANNYTDKRGLHWFENESLEQTEAPFVEGKRFALGTTQEKGYSTTFFANPFGPMQYAEECKPLIDEMFQALLKQGTPIGEVYTCLGLPNKGDHGINKAAEALLEFVKAKSE